MRSISTALFLATYASAAFNLKNPFDRIKSGLIPGLFGPPALLIDTFNDTAQNALGFFHGVAGDARFGEFEDVNGGNYLKVTTGDVDGSFITSLAEGCSDFTSYRHHYIHIQFNGSSKFSISLQQHNKDCDDAKLPFPQTYDSVKAARYVTEDNKHIYVPMAHFKVQLKQVSAIALENWFTNDTTFVYKIELLRSRTVPGTMKVIPKLKTGTLHAGCTNPNFIAFGIDDGVPENLQRTLQIIKDEQIPVTFFVQGVALQYSVDDGNFTEAYREMLNRGHQVGLHTMSHPHMESVKTEEDIELEISRNVDIVKAKLKIKTNYFRPPFGTIGSRTRQALARQIHNPQIIMWSIDVFDWIYGVGNATDPQRMQYKAFQDALNKGGTIVVMHYLYSSTVDQFRDMIRLAKAQGRQFVRMDQCIGDVKAPETWGWKRHL